MLGLSRELMEHQLSIKAVLDRTNKELGTSSQRSSEG
jgi:hypothetical protein